MRKYINVFDELVLGQGDYGKTVEGNWCARPPRSISSSVVLLENDIVEHEDGTISVMEELSIFGWQGKLIKGEWLE